MGGNPFILIDKVEQRTVLMNLKKQFSDAFKSECGATTTKGGTSFQHLGKVFCETFQSWERNRWVISLQE
eukprot:3986062-Ditylum_brightwellii.AAC.1